MKISIIELQMKIRKVWQSGFHVMLVIKHLWILKKKLVSFLEKMISLHLLHKPASIIDLLLFKNPPKKQLWVMVFWWSDCNVILYKCNQWFQKNPFFHLYFSQIQRRSIFWHILVFWWREYLNAFSSKGKKSTLFWSAAAIVTKICFNSSWLVI